MFNDQTESTIRQRMLDKIDLDLYKGEGSDLYQIVTPLAMELASFYAWLDYFKEVIFGRKLDENFVRRAEAFGVFRKMGEKASGRIEFTSSGPVTIAKGTRLVSGSRLFFELLEDLVFESKGNKSAMCAAENTGLEYNIGENSLQFVTEVSLITGISHSGFTNGIDIETLEQLQKRFLEKLQNPSSSGNIADYERWAKTIDGVVQVKVYPLANGPGTVKLVASGEKGACLTQDILTELTTTINELAPIGAQVQVLSTIKRTLNIQLTGFVANPAVDLKDLKDRISLAIQSHLGEIEPNALIYVRKILAVVMNVEGVKDVATITINGSKDSIQLGQVEKGGLGSVTYA